MKVIRNIIIVLIFIIAVAFCLYIAPKYKKTGNENKINLVINFSNVTGKMKGDVIRKNGNIYISLDDIKNYYDRYIFLDTKYNYIIAAKNGYIACFNINNNTVDINDKTIKAEIIKSNDMYYIPMNVLEELYNIKVQYKEKTNIVTIDSLDRQMTQAKLNKNISVKSSTALFSKTLEKLNKDSIVYIKDKENQSSNATQNEPTSIKGKINKGIKDIEKNNAEKWTCIKTENGTIGYVYNDSLYEKTTTKSKEEPNKKTISLAWEYYENTLATPKNGMNVEYKGVNVVSPSFFFLDENGNIRENVGDAGKEYIKWAKSKNYEIWPIVKCDNLLTDNMRGLLNDYQKRNQLINQIIQVTQKYNLDGINIDFENINSEDKNSFSRFIIELKPRLQRMGVVLSVDVTVPDGSPNWSLCYDRKTLGDIADYLVFMAYDQTSKKGKNVGSNASLKWVERNIQKFINNEEVAPEKIILAIPFYSRLWKLNNDGSIISGYDISIKDQNKYISKAKNKEWLEDENQYCIEYTEAGATYKMYLEEEKSISNKLDLIKKYNLAGGAYWEKGMETSNIWDVIEKKLF